MRRVTEKITLDEARKRLYEFGQLRWYGDTPNYRQLWKPSTLAGILWPESVFRSQQGAARAAVGVLSKIKEVSWKHRRIGNSNASTTGWDLSKLQRPVLEAKEDT